MCVLLLLLPLLLLLLLLVLLMGTDVVDACSAGKVEGGIAFYKLGLVWAEIERRGGIGGRVRIGS